MDKLLQLSWAAGLFEGEGYICLLGKRRKIQIGLSSTDEDVVRQFHFVVECGNVTGPTLRDNRKPCWHWRAHGERAAKSLYSSFETYLGVRRKSRFIEVLDIQKNLPPKVPTGGRNRKLSDDNVRNIRKRLLIGEQQTALGREFGITQAQVWKIKEGRTYAHVE